MKTCKTCNIQKEIEAFPKSGYTGRSGYCRDCYNANRRKDRKANPEKYAKHDSWEVRCSKDPNYKEKYNARQRKWAANNPVKSKAQKRRSNLRRRAEGGITEEVRQFILDSYSSKCVYCGEEGKMEIDHIIPVSKGGTNHIDNLAPACRSCNASKNDRLLEEWVR